MLSVSTADFPLPDHVAPVGSSCWQDSAVPVERDAEFDRLVAEVRRVEGATLDHAPFLFKAVVALGAAILFGGAASLLLGVLPLVARFG